MKLWRFLAVHLGLQATNSWGLTFQEGPGDADPFYLTEEQSFQIAWYAAQSGEGDATSRGLRFKEEMAGKFLYILGDSTVRQVTLIEMGLFGTKMTQEELKAHVRSDKCTRPQNMSTYDAKMYPGFGKAPCWKNEQKCDWYFANQSSLTYEFMHFLHDTRHDYLFNPTVMRSDPTHDFHAKLPDIMVIGIPVHVCYHTNKQMFTTDTYKNLTAERELVSMLPHLFENVRKVYQGPIFWLEAGGVNFLPENNDYMRCVRGVNADLNRLAAKDKDSAVIHRVQVESEWVKEHPEDKDVHKATPCIIKVAKQLNQAILKRLKPQEMAEAGDDFN